VDFSERVSGALLRLRQGDQGVSSQDALLTVQPDEKQILMNAEVSP